MRKEMNEINRTVEELAVQRKLKVSYSAENKTAAVPDSSAGRYSNSNGFLNQKQLSDEELVRSFVESQDEEAFSEIVNRYGDKIYRLALRITHNPSGAEDIHQEVFITLIVKLYTFHEGPKFSAWLYRVATNASYMHLRAEKKHNKDVSLEGYVSYDGDGTLKGVKAKDWSGRPDEVFFSKEGMEMIEKAVNELPVDYKVVFHLRDVEGFSNEDVAEVLGLSVPNVKFRIHRVRLFLRDKLLDYFYEWRK
jgi:RNA polymerase sigma-70 factor (ECF subfamily)